MADFQRLIGEFSQLDVALYAFSTDPPEEAVKTLRERDLSFPVLCSLDGPKTAELLEAVHEQKRNIIQPCAFILRDGFILNASYSTGPVGRLSAADALALIRFLQKKD